MSANPSQQGWDDYLTSSFSFVSNPAGNPPTLEEIAATDRWGARFDVNDQAWFTVHIKHGYKEGTSIYPHVHWEHDGSGVDGDSDIVKKYFLP